MILLGLVGTPASGKSTVAKHLQSKGATWLNADLIARDVLNQSDVTSQLANHFGDGILSDDGKIDRSVLASEVFGDAIEKRAALDFLESVIHPPTRNEITRCLRASFDKGVQVALLDVPLLFESKWDRSCDSIWCIDAPLEKRLEWSASRGWDAEEMRRRESSQMAIAEKQRLSNVFVSNDGTLAELLENLDSLWSNLATIRVGGSEATESHCFARDERSLSAE